MKSPHSIACAGLALMTAGLLFEAQAADWPSLLTGPGRNFGKDVTVALDGSVYATGMVGPGARLSSGLQALPRLPAGTPGPLDAYLLKLDAEGRALWLRPFGGPALEMPHSVQVSADGRIAVAGFFMQQGPYGASGASGGNGESVAAVGQRDGFVAFFDAEGAPRGGFTVGGPGVDEIFQQVFAPDGYSVIAGPFEEQITIGSTQLRSAGGRDGFVAKVDERGQPSWARRIGGAGVDAALAVAVDAEGDVYVGGGFSGQARFDSDTEASAQTLGSAGDWDGFIARYDGATGRLHWVRTFGGAGRDWVGAGGLAFHHGALLAIGDFEGTVDFGNARHLTSEGDADVFALRLDREGRTQMAARLGGRGADRGHRIAGAADGTLWITGWQRGPRGTVSVAAQGADSAQRLAFDADEPAALTSVFVARLAADGKPLWARAFGGAGTVPSAGGEDDYSNIGTGIAITRVGGAVLTGRLTGRIRVKDGERDAGGLSGFIVRFDANGDMQ
jgi:hypothetical protein